MSAAARRAWIGFLPLLGIGAPAGAHDKFQQMEGIEWPSPDSARRASGAPGDGYWQQRVDYRIVAHLDEDARRITGTATITYHNRSPDSLDAIWLLLDQNIHRADADAEVSRATRPGDPANMYELRRAMKLTGWSGGYSAIKAETLGGQPLATSLDGTMMRVALAEPVAPSGQTQFRVHWAVDLPETKAFGGRSGYECFDDAAANCIFLGGYWFPRTASYSHDVGWNHRQFLGAGEYSLEFGDYDVSLDVPADHVVAATGELANAGEVLTALQRSRWDAARDASSPVFIVTPDEALAAERTRSAQRKTWRFTARDVRDFGFASSRKFIWDAMGVRQPDSRNPLVMAMSFYPDEGRPLWNIYSTRAIAHTLAVFGDMVFPYPYPVAQSVNGPAIGIEHPMISFTGMRPVRDSITGDITYTEQAKAALIGTVIHEVGHNWFPMIVNSDERQWGWLDEGLVTFLQYEAQKRWDPDFPFARGSPRDIAAAMKAPGHAPIMRSTETLPNIQHSAYAKPASALVLLRETILGRERFDRAFRAYGARWRFKRATPFDFFRTMEDVSGVDLDWFWRGWFYSTDHVDLAIDRVEKGLPTLKAPVAPGSGAAGPARDSGAATAKDAATMADRFPELRDFYDIQPVVGSGGAVAGKGEAARAQALAVDQAAIDELPNLYLFTLSNRGGLVSPVILKLDYSDETSETVRIPAEVWRRYPDGLVWRHLTEKTLVRAEIDPLGQTADADPANNIFDGPIAQVVLSVTPSAVAPNGLRDADLRVTGDSVAPIAASKRDTLSHP
ncbi:M1 family metallopeptidase [Sphingopyxis chilensis]